MRTGLWLLYQNGVLFVFAFVIGAVVGSFLNVVIHRWPRGESIVSPGSHCPSCRQPIPWYWNLPVISWLLLLGKCRWCGARISARYFLIEVAGGLWAAGVLWRFGPGLETIAYFAFGAALMVAGVIDVQYRLLPDVITIGSIPFGLIMAYLPRRWVPLWPVSGLEAIIGAAGGAVLFLAVSLAFKYATGKEGMGLGDVKLIAALGAFLGYPAIPALIIMASMGGILTWLTLAVFKRAGRDYPVPYGLFLSAAALAVIILRPWLERKAIILHWF